MRRIRNERLQQRRDFEVSQKRRRVDQIETMIVEFERERLYLGHQVEIEELRAKNHDPAHFAYPAFASAARERFLKIQQSEDAFLRELERLKLELTDANTLDLGSGIPNANIAEQSKIDHRQVKAYMSFTYQGHSAGRRARTPVGQSSTE